MQTSCPWASPPTSLAPTPTTLQPCCCFLTCMQPVPTSGPLSMSTCSLHLDTLPLFHPWPAPPPPASLSRKVTAQGSFSRWNPSRSSPRLSPSLPRVSFSLNSYLPILSNLRAPSIHKLGGKPMRAGRSCLFLLSPVPSTWHKAGTPRL